MDYPSFESVVETLRAADISTSASAMAASTDLLGDKKRIRKTFVRHVVGRVERDFPGRPFSELTILELGAGAGFFALSYAEVFPHLPLKNLLQTDTYPRDDAGAITQLDVADLSREGHPISRHKFDVVLSIDLLSCLAFGRGLDPDDEDDVDEMRHLDLALARMLEPGGKYYDFMACAPNAQFIMRFVPDYALSDASLASPRFIIVCDNGQDGQGATGNGVLLFVTFDASLLRHTGTDAAGETLLQVAGLDRPFTYEELSQHLGLLERHKHLESAPAFIKKVLGYMFRDINDGGGSSNWELMSYVFVDPTHFHEVFEDDRAALAPVFQDTFARTVQFLRDSFKGAASYREIPLIEAFRSTTLAHLASVSVEHLEEDVLGTRGDSFMQVYDYAHVYDGKGGANGEGSFRYLLTTATARGTQAHPGSHSQAADFPQSSDAMQIS